LPFQLLEISSIDGVSIADVAMEAENIGDESFNPDVHTKGTHSIVHSVTSVDLISMEDKRDHALLKDGTKQVAVVSAANDACSRNTK
jgi:hypothetical protein